MLWSTKKKHVSKKFSLSVTIIQIITTNLNYFTRLIGQVPKLGRKDG